MRTVAEVEVYPYSDRMVTVDELTTVAHRCDYIFAMHETMIPAEVFAGEIRLRGIVVGGRDASDMIDVAVGEAAGVTLISTPPAGGEARKGNAKATADLTLALLLCLAYRVVEADTYTRQHRVWQEMTMDLMGVGATNKVAGIVGMGRVAMELVPRLKALDMQVIYTKRTRLAPDEEAVLGIEWAPELPTLLGRSDYVIMLANYNASAHKLMGADDFALMKPTAYFINPGRGRLVDEPAMIEALQTGVIAGAGLDVYWNEPPVTHDASVPLALRKLDNVVLTPHNGGATWDSRTRQTVGMAEALVEHIRVAG
jgi:glyoxylate reductase